MVMSEILESTDSSGRDLEIKNVAATSIMKKIKSLMSRRNSHTYGSSQYDNYTGRIKALKKEFDNMQEPFIEQKEK